MVVKVQVLIDPFPAFRDALVILDIDIFVLERAPETFGENVVKDPATAIHADPDVLSFQYPRERNAGKLRALISIEDLRTTHIHCLVESIQTEIHLQASRKTPGDDIAAPPVHYGYQVHKATMKSDTRYVRRPNLIRPINDHVSQ